MDYATRSGLARAQIEKMLLEKSTFVDICDFIERKYFLGEVFVKRKIKSITAKQEQDLRKALISKGKTESEIDEIVKNTIYRGV